MLKLNFNDDEFCSVLNDYISMLLPHEHLTSENFGITLDTVFKYVKLEEMDVPYLLIFKTLDDLRRISSTVPGFSPKLTKETFDEILSASLKDFIDNNRFKVNAWIATRGIGDNLDIPEVFTQASSEIYRDVIDIYEESFERKIPTSTYLVKSLVLKNKLVSNAVTNSLQTQVEIINSSVKIGKKYYSGYNGTIEYTNMVNTELSKRCNDLDDNELFSLDDTVKGKHLLEETKKLYVPLAEYGIPELDDRTPMFKHRLVVLCAKENVGKTLNACHQVVTLLLAGRRVLYMHGESPRGEVYNKILSNYILRKHKIFVTPSQIGGIEDCYEETSRIINIATAELASTGNLNLIGELTYGNVYNELVSLYDNIKYDALIVDHSGALNGGSEYRLLTRQDKIDSLAVDLRMFKKKYPVYIQVLSHLSSEAINELKKGTAIVSSPTAFSSVLSREADELFIMFTNEICEKSNLRGLIIFKRRGAKKPTNPIYLKINGTYSEFKYDPKYQDSGDDSTSKNIALSKIESAYLDDNDDNDDEGIEVDLFAD